MPRAADSDSPHIDSGTPICELKLRGLRDTSANGSISWNIHSLSVVLPREPVMANSVP